MMEEGGSNRTKRATMEERLEEEIEHKQKMKTLRETLCKYGHNLIAIPRLRIPILPTLDPLDLRTTLS